MRTHDSATLVNQIQEKIQCLNPEQLNFFIRWLGDHTTLIDLEDEVQRQANLTAWLERHTVDKAQEEYRLIIAEIIWCADTPLLELRRIASSEARRSFDD